MTQGDRLAAAAKKYVGVIREIERTTSPARLRILEEKRVELHWEFIDILKRLGIPVQGRDHATRIAFEIAGENP